MMRKIVHTLVLTLAALMVPNVAYSRIVYGDVNGDQDVDIADVSAVIDIILGRNAQITAADVNSDDEINIVDVDAIIDVILGKETTEHKYVDLGLPSGTLWATMNIGARTPGEAGDYFAWGETDPKAYYDWTTYKWGDGSRKRLTKYCTDRAYGTFDGKTELELEDDAAYVNWGPSWRMPSEAQREELCDNCTWEWARRNGAYGYLVTGPNGNSIFLPAAGNFHGISVSDAGLLGYYWLRSLTEYFEPTSAYYMYFYPEGWNTQVSGNRDWGYSVRAVRVSPDDNQNLYIEQDVLLMGEVPIGETSTGKLTIINNALEAMTLTVTTDEPFSLYQDWDYAQSMTVKVPSKSCVQVTVAFTASSPGQFIGNVTFQNPALDGGQSVIPVYAHAGDDIVPQEEWVDLGLPSGTLWATRNVGANSPEDYGAYFAWGETEPKEYYEWNTYKWCDGSIDALTKYCLDSDYGTVDNKTELELEDDAAYVNWGPSWRMPTPDQFRELYDNCTGQWTAMNGVNGWLVTGPNGNRMFLPAAGERRGETLYMAGTDGNYWANTLRGTSFNADELLFTSRAMVWQINFNYRCCGHSVRPVRVPQN